MTARDKLLLSGVGYVCQWLVHLAADKQIRDAESFSDLKETTLKDLNILGILYF